MKKFIFKYFQLIFELNDFSKAKMNRETEKDMVQTEEEKAICDFCQSEVYEIERDCLIKIFNQDMFWNK